MQAELCQELTLTSPWLVQGNLELKHQLIWSVGRKARFSTYDGCSGVSHRKHFCGEGLQARAEEMAPEQATTKPKLRCTEWALHIDE